jgi:hypothetical protein
MELYMLNNEPVSAVYHAASQTTSSSMEYTTTKDNDKS